MKCPSCNGTGYYFGLDAYIPCDICKGTKELPENIDYDPGRGLKLYEDRIDNRITLRKFCLDNKIDPCERSREERGFFEK